MADNRSQWTLRELAYVMEKEIGHRVTVSDIKMMLGRAIVQNEIADCLRSHFNLPEVDDDLDRA